MTTRTDRGRSRLNKERGQSSNGGCLALASSLSVTSYFPGFRDLDIIRFVLVSRINLLQVIRLNTFCSQCLTWCVICLNY